MKDKMIAYCGLDCGKCPAFYAAERLTIKERQKIADQWKQEYNADMTAKDIDCVGCLPTDGIHVGHCSVCEIRLCGLKRDITTCADCNEYACSRLTDFFKHVPDAEKNLEMLKNS